MRSGTDRAFRWLGVACLLCAVGYWMSPYVAFIRFARAAADADTPAIIARLDIPRLRMALARQIVRAYPADPRISAALDPAARYAANRVAASYIDVLIAEHLSADAIVRVISAQPGINEGNGSILNLPPIQDFGGAWDIFTSAGFTGPITFSLDVPARPEGTYRLGLRLVDGSWKLASLGLPAGVITQAVKLLKERSSARRPS